MSETRVTSRCPALYLKVDRRRWSDCGHEGRSFFFFLYQCLPGGEDVWIECTIEGKRVIVANVGVIYRPPSQSSDDLTAFLSTFDNSIQKALNSCNIVCILGDFNANFQTSGSQMVRQTKPEHYCPARP